MRVNPDPAVISVPPLQSPKAKTAPLAADGVRVVEQVGFDEEVTPLQVASIVPAVLRPVNGATDIEL